MQMAGVRLRSLCGALAAAGHGGWVRQERWESMTWVQGVRYWNTSATIRSSQLSSTKVQKRLRVTRHSCYKEGRKLLPLLPQWEKFTAQYS